MSKRFMTLAYAGGIWASKNDSKCYEQVTRPDSTFGRAIYYCKESRYFNPWVEAIGVRPDRYRVHIIHGLGECCNV